jgi:ParB/RepB/Spo0J family partition protein
MKNITNARLVETATIQVPEKYRRHGSIVEDDKLRLSIEVTGIQQPLVVSKISDQKYVLIDGNRRLEVAKFLKFQEVPCIIDEIPTGVPAEEYRDRIRFILDEHRQDLFPSQRALLIKNLKKNFEMNNRQVGEYLGVDATTVANWLEVDSYIPDVTKAIDAGEITQHAARVFEGMTEAGQRKIWESHKRELETVSAAKLHKKLREKYHPTTHPQYYAEPEKVTRKLKRAHQKRKATRRPVITKTERDILFSDIETREAELRDAKKDLDQYKLEITLATRIIGSILENDELLKLVPSEALADLQRFAEIYV